MTLAAAACLDRPIGSPPPVTTNIFVDKITQTSVDKIDLLFMIDNSISMSDKQEILRDAVPDLVRRLVNPICVDAQGTQEDAAETGTPCRDGFTQEFNPIKDINIGIVSSSLGDVGANASCPSMGYPMYVPDRVDMAHLVGSLDRSRAKGNAQGFLEWRAGTTQLDDLNRDFQRQVTDVGENGCGWEASLESWYRFLVDPVPYKELARVQCRMSDSAQANCVQPATGADNRIILDTDLLKQRDLFLRDDSLVAIIMLTDENDCSAQVGNQTWVVFNTQDMRPMFKGSAACADDPNSKCCYSCPLTPPAGCTPDPACGTMPTSPERRLAAELDGQNLRCYQQKRRFGVDFLYPTERYVNALTQFDLCWNALDLSTDECDDADIRANPLFEGGRLPSLVFLGGIVGVPWQTIESKVDANNRPITAANQLRFKTYKELSTDGTWDKILGSPGVAWRPATAKRAEVPGSPGALPTLPQMVESPQFPRPNIMVGNQINGRDYDTTQGAAPQGNVGPKADDLQYACIFPLATPRDCAALDPNVDNCDCYPGVFNRPLCEQTPGSSAPSTTQYWAKAYPGLRELQVLKDFGETSGNSIVASICARNVRNAMDPDYGYRPAIAAIVDRLKEQLGNRCLPRALDLQEDGTVPCTLVETLPQPPKDPQTGAKLACPQCDAKYARRLPSAQVDSVVRGQLSLELNKPCGASDPDCTESCLCEVLQVQQVDRPDKDQALNACRRDTDVQGVEGWCYVDDNPALSNPELVANCPATGKRLLRFVGSGLGANTTTYVACTGSSFAARQ